MDLRNEVQVDRLHQGAAAKGRLLERKRIVLQSPAQTQAYPYPFDDMSVTSSYTAKLRTDPSN